MQSQDEEEDAGGCILAHDMGLGKSPQTVAFLHTFHAYFPDKRSLLVVPVNVVHNWLDEFTAWLPDSSGADSSELTRDKACHLFLLLQHFADSVRVPASSTGDK